MNSTTLMREDIQTWIWQRAHTLQLDNFLSAKELPLVVGWLLAGRRGLADRASTKRDAAEVSLGRHHSGAVIGKPLEGEREMIAIEAIKFNHNPGSATHDAFNIRRNATQVVRVPEWRRFISVNPEDSPAAYAVRPRRETTSHRSFAHYR